MNKCEEENVLRIEMACGTMILRLDGYRRVFADTSADCAPKVKALLDEVGLAYSADLATVWCADKAYQTRDEGGLVESLVRRGHALLTEKNSMSLKSTKETETGEWTEVESGIFYMNEYAPKIFGEVFKNRGCWTWRITIAGVKICGPLGSLSHEDVMKDCDATFRRMAAAFREADEAAGTGARTS